MARGKCTFRQRDLTAAIKAVVAAGHQVSRIEIDPTGKIAVVIGSSDEAPVIERNEWDDAV